MTAPEFTTLVADDWRDYALLDSGAGRKLERVGPYTFVRPEPLALWAPRTDESDWAHADAVFSANAVGDDDDAAGRWRTTRALPESWPMQWDGLTFHARTTPFRHLAVFPEHSVHWRFAAARANANGETLNLFGYTGLASLACARAGGRVTHVDASKRAIAFARENQAAAGLDAAPIRWIVDDAHAFVKREIRRGRRYQGVILDPPKYGRGPKGETWRIEEKLSELLSDCAALLDHGGADRFLILTVYAVRLTPLALAQTAQAAMPLPGQWTFGEMALPHANDDRLLPTAIFARWSSR
ncbi:MAG: class I SAM-dependent rRNA methyltransferase [Alphaproteobacteria bacterium]|nr:class I SAM-dependent rRNA methyltransferase [Alphaproteobacteria bacterium]